MVLVGIVEVLTDPDPALAERVSLRGPGLVVLVEN